MNENKLLPCPFCGGAAETEGYYVKCSDCYDTRQDDGGAKVWIESDDADRARCVAAWNRRSVSAVPPKGWQWHHDWQAALLARDGTMCETHPGLDWPHGDCVGAASDAREAAIEECAKVCDAAGAAFFQSMRDNGHTLAGDAQRDTARAMERVAASIRALSSPPPRTQEPEQPQ